MADNKGGKVYEFTPRKSRKLKTVNYVSPEKRLLEQERKQAQKDKGNFYIGVGIFLLIVVAFTVIRLS